MMTPSFDFWGASRPAEGFRSLFGSATESAKETAADAVLAAQTAKIDAEIALDQRQIRLIQERLGPDIYGALLEEEKDLPEHVKQLFEHYRYTEVELLAQQLSQMQAEMQYLRHASKDVEEQQLEAEQAIGKVETEERDEFLLYDQISRLRLAEEEAASIASSTCTNCSNTLLTDSEFCRLCGTKRSSSVRETSSVRPLSVDDITQLRIADEQALGVHSAQQRLAAHQRTLLVTTHTDGSAAETEECEMSEREQQQVEAKGSPICVDDIKESLKLRRIEEREMMLGASDKEPHENWYLISSNWLKKMAEVYL